MENEVAGPIPMLIGLAVTFVYMAYVVFVPKNDDNKDDKEGDDR